MKVQLHKAHPWHGISIGEKSPEIITSFIEMVPADHVKYEIDLKSFLISFQPCMALFLKLIVAI